MKQQKTTIEDKKPKFRIRDFANSCFLEQFCKNIALDGLSIDGVEEELRQVCTNKDDIQPIINVLKELKTIYSNGKLHYKDKNPDELYTTLMSTLSKDSIDISRGKCPNIDVIFYRLYQNDLDLNTLLFDELYPIDDNNSLYKKENLTEIEEPSCQKRLAQTLGEKTIGIHSETGKKIAYYGAAHPESSYDKLINGMLGYNYQPMFYNNVPYMYDKSSSPTNAARLRIGTQVQQVRYVTKGGAQETKVPGCFLNYLRSLEKRTDSQSRQYHHAYINLQKSMKGYKGGMFSNIERKAEDVRTKALHALEKDHKHLAVITLPADNSDFFLKKFSKHTGRIVFLGDNKEDFQSEQQILDDLINAIDQNEKDFYMSADIKQALFGGQSRDNIKSTITPLFQKCLKDITANQSLDQKLTMLQRQALLFHFIKYEFEHYIIKTLNPLSFNTSCKDAIDRAGIQNLWSIFCARIDSNQPVSLREFEKLLNIPAIIVKDRPINDHIHLITNVLGHYYYHLPADKQQLIPWAKNWINIHSPYKMFINEKENIYTINDDGNPENNKEIAKKFTITNELYQAVCDGHVEKFEELIQNKDYQQKFWDNDKVQSDTILIAAARNGKFDLVKKILESHDDDKKKYFQGIRSKHPKDCGGCLNYLCRHLSQQTLDIEGEKNSIIECIKSFMDSTIHKSAWTTNFKDYTSVIDEFQMTPLDYLAELGDIEVLETLATYKFENKGALGMATTLFSWGTGKDQTYYFHDIFNLKPQEFEQSPLMRAAEKGHIQFVKKLIELDKGGLYTSKEREKCLELAKQVQKQNQSDLEKSTNQFGSQLNLSAPDEKTEKPKKKFK